MYLFVDTSQLAQLEEHMEGEQKGMARLLKVATVGIATFAWQELRQGTKRNTSRHSEKAKTKYTNKSTLNSKPY